MGLNSDRTCKVFYVNICCLSTRFYFLVPQWHSHPSFIKIVDVFDLYTHKTRTFTMRLAVTTSTKETVFHRGVAWTRPPKSRPNRSHRKRSYSISKIGNMMGCDHPSCDPVDPLGASCGISNIFQQRPSTILKFKNFNILSRDCHCCPNLLLYTKFHQNWFTCSAFRRP